MMVRGSLPSLIQGISQQSPDIRPKDYIEDGVNVYPTIIEGLSRRPGADHVAGISPMTNPAAVHWIVRDELERYLVAVESGVVRVWDLAGNAKTVNAPDGWSYITTALSSGGNIGFSTVNDYTFIYDRNRVVQMAGTTEPTDANTSHVWIRQGDYSTKYTIRVGYPVSSPTWYTATHTTSASTAADIKLDAIQQALASALVAVLPGGGVWNVAGQDHVIFLARADGANFILEVHDDATSKNIVAVKDSVASVTDLPSLASEGTHIRIRGEEGNERDDWWAKFTGTNPTGFSKGYWQECPKPGTQIAFDAATMPHVLVREGDGTFTFRKVQWANRVSGGDTYNPKPQFVGQTIQHVGSEKSRLSFCGANYYTTSRGDGDLFNFWQQSVQVLQDSDPVDISPSYPKPFVLKASAEFQRGLVLFADNVQFVITSGDVFGPKTIGRQPISAYSLDVTKGFLGLQQDRILCALKRENVTGLQTFKASSTNTGDITFDETSAVVPALIKGSVDWITGSDTENVVVMRASGSTKLYVYKEAMDGGKVIQSAWLPWEFKNRTPVSGKFIGPIFYVLLKDSSNVFTIERLSLLPFQSNQIAWDITLDRRATRTSGHFSQGSTTTSVTLPWTPTTGETVILVFTSGPHTGAVIKAASVLGNVATFQGLYAGANAVVGVSARSTATLSRLYFRRPTLGGGEEVVTEGVLQVLRGTVNFTKSGPFQIQIKPTDRSETFTENVAIPLFEQPDYQSPQDLQTGSTDFPIGAFNDRVTITFDSGEGPMPMRIGSFEWKGDLNLRARPV